MAGVRRFEELIAWQRARVLTRSVYAATRVVPFSRDYGLCDQIRRASVSIMSNIAEGFDRGSPGEFHQYLCTAKGSCAEVRAQLYVALDVGYLQPAAFDSLLATTEEVSRLVGGLRTSAERHRRG